MTEPRAEGIETRAGILPQSLSLGGLFSTNNPLMQIFLFGIVSQLVGAAVQPGVQAISSTVWPKFPQTPLSPVDAAAAVERGAMTKDAAAAEALLSGVNRQRFDILEEMAGLAPGPQDLSVALRRHIINQDRYERGIRQGTVRTEWADMYRKMAVQEPSPIEPLEALLEGQLSESDAKSLYLQYGGDPDSFEWRFNSRGTAPSPLQAAEMARRGIIPWDGHGPSVVSYEQALLEGPYRNKWSKPIRTLADYIPPPRTIVAMYREGSINHDVAVKYLKANGVPDDLVPAFLTAASTQKTQTTKDLTQATIVGLYEDQLITTAQATEMLTDMRYSDDEAGYILAAADFRLHAKYLGLARSRVHTLYVGHHIDRGEAITALAKLGVDAGDVTKVMQTWDLERGINTKLLTPAEIASARHYDIISGADALAKLVELGYSEADAWVYLAAHNKGNYSDLGSPPAGVHPKYGPTGPGPTLPVP